MRQSKTMSLIESCVNVTTGILIAWNLTYWVLPFLGNTYTMAETTVITLMYTSVSVLRGYFWRRIFSKGEV